MGSTTCVALLLLPLALTGPALLTGKVYGPIDLPWGAEPLLSMREEAGLVPASPGNRYDIAYQMIPWSKAVRFALRNGEWPTWNPFMLCGDILAATAQPATYHPLQLLGYLLTLGQSLTFLASMALFVAGAGTYCFAREIGCRDGAALIGAAGFMFCGFMLFWMNWPMMHTFAFFPVLLLGVRCLVRGPGPRSAALLVATFVLVGLAGHPESALHCVAVAALWGAGELIFRRPRQTIRVLLFGSLAASLAVLICAVYLLPIIEILPETFAYGFRASEVRESVSWNMALERLRVVLVPFAHGVPWAERMSGAGYPDSAYYPYVGSVLLAPALLGLCFSPWRGRWAMALLGVGALWLYAEAPGLTDLVSRIPLFHVSINKRLILMAGFAVSILAALGMEVWARGPNRDRLWRLQLLALALQALFIVLCWAGIKRTRMTETLLWELTGLELVPLVVAAILFYRVRSVRAGLWCLLLLIVTQRVVQTRDLNPSFSESFFYPAPKEFGVLPPNDPPYRVAAKRWTFTAGTSTLYEIEDVRGYTPLINRRLLSTFPLWNLPEIPREIPNIVDFDRPFLAFLNVRFALIANDEEAPPGWPTWVSGQGFTIRENPKFIPRAFVPERVRHGLPANRAFREMERATDFKKVAWIELRHPEAWKGKREQDNGPGTVTVTRRGLGIEITASMQKPGWVVVSETAWKGWQAESGGKSIPLHYANRAFLSFRLPTGEHRVHLYYRPAGFVLGRAVTLATLGLILVVWPLSRAWRRRDYKFR